MPKSRGGNITVNSAVGSDLLAVGGNINITDRSSVGGDLALVGGNIDLDAPVTGTVRLSGGSIRINSAITGELIVRAGQNLTFGANARIPGKITYFGSSQPTIEQGAQVGSIDRRQLPSRNGNRGPFRGLVSLFNILATLVALGVLYLLFPRIVDRLTVNATGHFLPNLGIGLLGLIAAPIIIIILLVTIIGYMLALLLLLTYLLMLIIAFLLSVSLVGYWIIRLFGKDRNQVSWFSLILGIAVFTILGLIPIIGGVVVFIIFLAALGTLLRSGFWNMRNNNKLLPSDV